MQQRLKEIQKQLKERDFDALICEDTTMFFYLTGLSVSAGICLVTQEEAHILVDSRYAESAKSHSDFPVLLKKSDTLEKLLSSLPIKKIAFDSEQSTYAQYQSWIKSAKQASLTPVDGLFQEIRMIKDSRELEALTQAAKLGSQGFDYGVELLREGITEEEVAREIELFWRKKGGEGAAFEPIIAFGAGSSMPHYRAQGKKLKQGMSVLMDIGVTLNHYHSDMTRVVFFGEPGPQILEIYEIVIRAQAAALAKCSPAYTLQDIDRAARKVIDESGFGDLFTHSLGHGIGLEVHEQPYFRTKEKGVEDAVKAGMVFTIEPGIYLPSVGGVRIEDTVLITESGHLNLTNRSKELTVISL
jgi:Xaa-Pro aminopeptidase